MVPRRRSQLLLAGLLIATCATPRLLCSAEKNVKAPTMEDVGDGTRRLLIPNDISELLQREFPGSRMPVESDFSEEMRQYYNSRLIGVNPAVAFGDFNGDKKRDYLFLLITGDTKWGPLCELVAANGDRKSFEVFRLGEVYNFKEDYVSFQDNKLLKGRFKKGAWYINWDQKKSTYIVTKS